MKTLRPTMYRLLAPKLEGYATGTQYVNFKQQLSLCENTSSGSVY